MKIQEDKIKEYSGTSFNVVKRDGVSILEFNDKTSIDNVELYATVMLGDCKDCEKVNELYKDFTYDKVLVLGLGLGLVPETLKVEKECSVVDVVENNQELIDYIDFIDDSINVIKDDAYSYTPDKKYDLILIDLWWGHEDITDEIVSDLENNYKNHLEEEGKIIIPILFKSISV
jgi:hypothetical protein|tara:strand:+ start:4513 stop:5034 length:522 start_codon:yes stop_codon:yes gene_type:complete